MDTPPSNDPAEALPRLYLQNLLIPASLNTLLQHRIITAFTPTELNQLLNFNESNHWICWSDQSEGPIR